MVIGSCSDPSMSSTRPIMVAGPMERNSKPFNKGSVDTFGDGPVGCPPPRPCPHAMLAVPRQTAAIVDIVNQRRHKSGVRILVTLSKANFGCPAIMDTLSQTTGLGLTLVAVSPRTQPATLPA